MHVRGLHIRDCTLITRQFISAISSRNISEDGDWLQNMASYSDSNADLKYEIIIYLYIQRYL